MLVIKTVTMKVKKELFPKLSKLPNGRYYVYFWYEGNRYRFYNGNVLGEKINPNLLEEPEREKTAILLCSTFVVSLNKGWRPNRRRQFKKAEELTIGEIAETVFKRKERLDYSSSYKSDLKRTLRQWNEFLNDQKLLNRPLRDLEIGKIQEFIFSYASSPQSMANLKRNISSLLRDEMEAKVSIFKAHQTSELHNSFIDPSKMFKDRYDTEAFNDNLYICALMTFSS